MNLTKTLIGAAAALCVPVVALVAAPSEAELRSKVLDLMSRMTVEEKVGQLVQYSSQDNATGPKDDAVNLEAELRAGRIGSLLNIVGAARTRSLQTVAVKESRLGIPLIFGYDVIHGYQTIFPINLGQAASWDMKAIEGSERIAASEASAAGIHWTFAPMVDVARDPRWGRVSEGSGEDTFLGSAIARARVRGFQGKDLSQRDSLVACAKHFAAYGAAQAGRDYAGVDMSIFTLRDVYLPPFKAAVESGVGTFMASFNELNGLPASAHPVLLDSILRREWGFQGFVVSDYNAVRELVNHGYAADNKEAARLSFNAGLDMDMEGHCFMKHLPGLVSSGDVNTQRLDSAVYAILMTKARLGLFQDPFRNCDTTVEAVRMLRKEHLEAARDLARRSCVLLQNNKAALPIKKGVRVGLIGPLADSARDLLGSWNGQGREEDTQSLKAYFEKSPQGEVVYARGCDISGTDTSGIEEAVKVAKRASVVVVAIGEAWDMTGEAASRTSLDLPGQQLELLRKVRAATTKPVIAVVMAGRPLILSEVRKHADAILYAWFPGTMGAAAVHDLLYGVVSPSGKLPITFPRSVGQVPIFYSHRMTGRPQDPDTAAIKYRSNYLDSLNSPEFAFGHGLSYTRFVYSDITLSSKVLRPNQVIQVSVTVANKGAMAGDEIVQLYVRDVVGGLVRPVRELKGFARLPLKVGDSLTVNFSLRPSDLAYTQLDGRFAPEPGRFEVFVGGDSNAPKVGEFEYSEK